MAPFSGYEARKLLGPERDIAAVAWSGIWVVEPDEAFVYRGVNKSGRLGGLRIPESEATSYRGVMAMPSTQLRFAGGTELALGDDGTEAGLLGGANAIIGGNYLTTFGRPMERDRDAVDHVLEVESGRISLPITPLGEKRNSGHGALYDTLKSL